ncbi:bifunctional diguanylate cyclase/phosphodiesterase [Aliamphritea hakodatensis]|uniref:bifunctional diguanylate cyclase/phosphodiesterase n=1 Tax=Aliamphritea hakodatensis TaxID=2895352 RepID=UPI0022FD7DE4|nr:GGDEF domain-containing protein [Aliamphritea hakodatensis]
MKLNNKNKLLCSILSLLVLGLLASALVAYLYISSAQRQALQNEHLVKARATTEKLTHWLSENLAIISHYAEVITEHPQGLRDNPALQAYLRQSTATGRFDYISYSLESDGYMWINDWEIPANYNPRLRPWYISSKQAMRPTIPEPYLSVDTDPHRYLAVTAPLLRDGNFIGMVLGDVPMEFVKNTVMDTRLDFSGEVFITDHQGKVLIHKSDQMEGLNQTTLLGDNLPTDSAAASVEKVGADRSTAGNAQVLETEGYIYTVSSIGVAGWRLVFAQQKSILNKQLLKSTLNLLSAFVGIFLMVLTLLFISNRHVFSPLLNLLEQDANTGLANKRTFKDLISHQYIDANVPGMLLIINVNNFNLLTAALSGPAIARLQNEIKSRIQQTLPPDTQLGMFSENRFIAFLPNHGHMEQRDQLFKLQQLQETLTHYYTVKDQQITCTFRQGVCFFPQHGSHIEQLIDRAFSVMGNAKKNTSRGNIAVYSPDVDQQLSEDLRIFSAIHNGLRNHEFELAFQPQYDLHQQAFKGVEVLLRWYSGELGRQVSPAEFIPISEASNLIISLGDFVIRATLQQITLWREQGIHFDTVSINISPKQLLQHNFVDKLIAATERFQVPAEQIELEITESLLFDDPDLCIRLLQQLRSLGFTIAIDDFGTGYSSLQYLKLLPVDKLKVDRAFVKELETSPKDKVIISMVTEMAKALGFSTLAEGAESASQVEILRQAGYDMIQGYYYAKPMSATALVQFINRQT